MTDITRYKSVALKHETYKKLKTISENVLDINISLAQTITYLTDMYYAKVTADGYVKPLKGSAEYQKFKRDLLFPKQPKLTLVDGVANGQ